MFVGGRRKEIARKEKRKGEKRILLCFSLNSFAVNILKRVGIFVTFWGISRLLVLNASMWKY